MLKELKRCNSIGNVDGLLFLVSIISSREKISRNEILRRCSLENSAVINCPAAIDFFEYLKLVNTTSDDVFPLPKLDVLMDDDADKIVKKIAELSISRLIEDGIFDKAEVKFDVKRECMLIKRSVFPLDHAAIRNFLIMVGALSRGDDGDVFVTNEYESNWIEQIKSRRVLSIEQLFEQQERQNQRGMEAEEFVLKIEKERVPSKRDKIKRISDFDVSAGYDIVSYEKDDDIYPERFIEVKCYIGTPHFFWSENELDVAKIKAEKYLLCLVDYSRIKESGYKPEFIRNPYKTIFNGNNWLVNPSSYSVRRL